ncbi:hypothetical protein ACO2FA_13155 [Staphylococcus warneri]|jgi:hypothetical protein
MIAFYNIENNKLCITYKRYDCFGASMVEDYIELDINNPEVFVKYKLTQLVKEFEQPEIINIDINKIIIKRDGSKFDIQLPIQIENYVEELNINITFNYEESDTDFYNDVFFYKQIIFNLIVNIDEYNEKIKNIYDKNHYIEV